MVDAELASALGIKTVQLNAAFFQLCGQIPGLQLNIYTAPNIITILV
jgi:hypothetical protein